MATFPTNLNLSDTTPPPKPDAYNAEFQGDTPVPDPNSPGNYVRNGSMCYRVPPVGGAFIVTDDYDVSITDSGNFLICNSASPFTLTLPSAIPSFNYAAQGVWWVLIRNLGTGAVTLDPNGLNLDTSGSPITINQGDAYVISTDNTDYYSGVVALASGGGGGFTNPMTTLGDIIYENATPTAARLAGNTTTTRKFLRQTGTGSASAVPAWDTLIAGDIPNIAESQVTGLVSDLAAKAVSPLTTKGDIWGRSTVDARIPLGSDGQWLEADSTQTLGVKWANQPYDVVYALPGKPPANTRYLIVTFTRPVTFPANFSGAQGHCLTNPTSTATYTLEKNLSNCGTVVISTGGVFTFTSASGAAVNFAAGDYLTLVTPNPQDSTLADAGFTLAGTR